MLRKNLNPAWLDGYLAEVDAGLTHLRQKPTLLLWGDADAGFKESERSRFQRNIPEAILRFEDREQLERQRLSNSTVTHPTNPKG